MAKVDLKAVREAYLVLDKAIRIKMDFPTMYCKECGETDPEEGFYPLESWQSGSPFSGWMCNSCEKKIREELKAK